MVLRIGKLFLYVEFLVKGVLNMRKHTTQRTFKCPNCDTIMIAYKKSNKLTKLNHIKHMYCYKCKQTTGFIQISNY